MVLMYGAERVVSEESQTRVDGYTVLNLCMQCTPNRAILTVGNENNVDHS